MLSYTGTKKPISKKQGMQWLFWILGRIKGRKGWRKGGSWVQLGMRNDFLDSGSVGHDWWQQLIDYFKITGREDFAYSNAKNW